MKKFGVFVVCTTFSFFLTAVTATAQAPVPLGTAASYAVLAGDTITNTGATTIQGDLGLHPGTSVTGGPTVIGSSNVTNAAALQAKSDLRTAYLNAAGRPSPILLAGGTLGGRTLTPGLYKDDGEPASLGLTGTLTLDFQGNPNAVFIFQSASTLITAVGSKVVLINTGAGTGCNVFWQVGSAATLGTSTVFVGTIMAHDDISVSASVTVAGRLLAGGQANGAGAITLINDVITASTCGVVIVPPPPPPPPPPLLSDLTITKNHTGDFQQGGTGSYTLTARNLGPGTTTGMVTVTDTLPAGLTATAVSGTGWSCTLTPVTCTRSDSLPAGGTYPPITVTVNLASNPLIFSGNGLTFQSGDILLSMQDGTVQWRRHDWRLVKIMTSLTDGQAKGMAFDSSGNLLVTHYVGTSHSGNSVVKFDRTGNLTGLFGSGYDCNPSTIVFNQTGNPYIGQADCSGDILKLDARGNRLAQYDVAVENRGSSHILLDPDQCTMYYTSQGRNVKRFNVCTNTQMPDFNRIPLPDGIDGAHQFALLPDGGLLVADFSVIVRLDASGNLVRTYDVPGDTHCWLGMAFDLDRTSFWSTNWCNSSATRFDMVTGNVIESYVAADAAFMVKQIIVAPPGLSVVVINTAAVSGGGEVNISNSSASDPTTIITQPPIPVLSIGSGQNMGPFGTPLDDSEILRAYCVGNIWSLRVSNTLPYGPVRLLGTTNSQAWVIAEWATTDANGSFGVGGSFANGTQGSHTLRVEIDGKVSNTLSFEISNCSP